MVTGRLPDEIGGDGAPPQWGITIGGVAMRTRTWKSLTLPLDLLGLPAVTISTEGR
jgi:hypothetical protein